MTNTPARQTGPVIAPAANVPYIPAQIMSIEDTGLSPLWLMDLALKVMYFQGYLTGYKVAEEVALPFSGVVDQIMESLKREKLIEVRSSQMGLGEGAYLYAITGLGIPALARPLTAANMPALHRYRWMSITSPLNGRGAAG